MSEKKQTKLVAVRLDSYTIDRIKQKIENEPLYEKNQSLFIKNAIEFYLKDVDKVSLKFNKVYDDLTDLMILLQTIRDLEPDKLTDNEYETLEILEKCERLLSNSTHKKQILFADDYKEISDL